MASAPTLTWEQYQQLPPEQRRRPLTPAEYAALTQQQRIAGGLEEDTSGAPANFSGPVFPNPNHLQPQLDTDSTIPVTRLPHGVTFNRQNAVGSPQMDVSNPAVADVMPQMGREIGAKMSTQPVMPQQDWFAANAPQAAATGDWFEQNSPKTATAEQPDQFASDKAVTDAWAQDHPILGPLARFLVSGGQNAANAITKTPSQMYHAIVDPPSDEEAGLTPEQRFIYRVGGKQAIQAGEDYAAGKVSPEAASSVLPEAYGTAVGQVAGGSVYGKAGDVAADVLPGVADTLANPTKISAPVRTVVKAANKALTKAPGTIGGAVGSAIGAKLGGGIGAEMGGVAGAMAGRELLPQVKIPGEGFGLPNRVTGGPEVAPQFEAPTEGEAATEEPTQPLPKVKAKTVRQSTALGPNAQVQTQAETLAPKPRTVVTDPATGRPEFSDVVEAKQAQPQPQAQTTAPETKPAPQETQAPIPETKAAPVEAKGTPAETPGPAADDLLERLKGVAERIQKQEAAAPGTADEDLLQQAQDSLDIVRARKATQTAQPAAPAETLDQFNQRLSAIADRKAAAAAGNAAGGASSAAGGLESVFQRLVKGEAGQAGLPGSVTNADEGIAEIQNRPVSATLTREVPARGYLNMVGADANSVLKTQRDLDSVFYHRQQIAQNGTPDVELHVDEGNNVIGAQGRHRALAAVQQGGPNAKVRVTIYKHPSATAE